MRIEVDALMYQFEKDLVKVVDAANVPALIKLYLQSAYYAGVEDEINSKFTMSKTYNCLKCGHKGTV